MNPAASIEDPVARAARLWPSATAMIHPLGRITFGELECYVSGTAGAISKRTTAPRVGLVPSATWRSIVRILAILRIRRVACLMSARWPHEMMTQAVASVGAELLSKPDELVQAESRTVPGHSSVPARQPATIIYTSATTGFPKAVLHTAGNHYYSARGANTVIPLGSDSRWLLSLPLYHIGGLGVVFRCLMAGAAILIPDAQESLGTQLLRDKCTHGSIVATQLWRLLQEPDLAVPPMLSALIVGGSSVPVETLREARRIGYPVCTTYGLTEMTSQVTTLAPEHPAAQLATSGKILPNRELQIAEDGEILVRGPVLFAGYANKQGVRRSLMPDGWFPTGDVGYLDENGFLHVEGRKDNMFISGGENIMPEAIERALCAMGGVRRAVVVSVPNQEFGACPVAFVDGIVDWGTLKNELGKMLPHFAVPQFRTWPAGVMPGDLKMNRAAFQKLAQQPSPPEETAGET